MAQTTSRPLALYALAALCLALSLAPSAHAACPVNCTQALSYTTITSPPGFAVSSGNSLSSCRRTCRYNDAPYYSFSSAGKGPLGPFYSPQEKPQSRGPAAGGLAWGPSQGQGYRVVTLNKEKVEAPETVPLAA